MQVNEGKIQITQNLNSLLDQFNNWYDVDTTMDKITLIIDQLASSPFYAQSKNELLDVVYQLGVYRIDVQAHLLIGSDNIFFQLKYADDAKLQQKIDNCILWADIIHNHYYDVCASLPPTFEKIKLIVIALLKITQN